MNSGCIGMIKPQSTPQNAESPEQRDEYRTMKGGFDITHKSKNAASTPCSVGIFPSFTNHATTCLTVNCSIALEASAAICRL